MTDGLQTITLIVGILVGLSALANNLQTMWLARLARINRELSEANGQALAAVAKRVDIARTQGVANHVAIKEVADQTNGLLADFKAAVISAAGKDTAAAFRDGQRDERAASGALVAEIKSAVSAGVADIASAVREVKQTERDRDIARPAG